MKLSECEMVKIVVGDHPAKVGHIVGLHQNSNSEIVPIVRWADGFEYPVHYANIYLLTDD